MNSKKNIVNVSESKKAKRNKSAARFIEIRQQIAKYGLHSLKAYKAACCIAASIIFVSESMSGKMTGIYSISTNCHCNGRCLQNMRDPGKICRHCFADNTIAMYNALQEHTADNAAILSFRVIPLGMLPHFKTDVDVFRLESFGDIINETHVLNYFNICRENPHVRFTIWTKNPDIMNAAIVRYGKPENLKIIVSSHYINSVAECNYTWVDHIFTVWENLETAENAGYKINCRAVVNGEEIDRCRNCMRCYTRGNREFYINELLK